MNNIQLKCVRGTIFVLLNVPHLQIQRGLLLPIVIVVHVQLLLCLLLLRPQIPNQIRQATRSRQAARLLLRQLVRVARRATAAARRVQRAFARRTLRTGALHQRMAGVQQQVMGVHGLVVMGRTTAAARRRCARVGGGAVVVAGLFAGRCSWQGVMAAL